MKAKCLNANVRQPSRSGRGLRSLVCSLLMAVAAGGTPLVAQSDPAGGNGSASAGPDALLEEFATRPLEVRLALSLVKLDGDIIMKLDQALATKPRQAVGATLEQENRLRVEALFTPVWITATELTLHVQLQIWEADSAGAYGQAPVASAYRAMPVALGDHVLLFPLGGEDQLQGNTRRFHFRADAFPVDPPQGHDAAGATEDGPVAVVIVMAVQVDLYEENEAPQQQNAVS